MAGGMVYLRCLNPSDVSRKAHVNVNVTVNVDAGSANQMNFNIHDGIIVAHGWRTQYAKRTSPEHCTSIYLTTLCDTLRQPGRQ